MSFFSRIKPVPFHQSKWKNKNFFGRQALTDFKNDVNDSHEKGLKVEKEIDQKAKNEKKQVYVHPFQELNKEVDIIVPEIIKVIDGLLEKFTGKGVVNKVKSFLNVARTQFANLTEIKSNLTQHYTDLQNKLVEYLGGEGMNSRFALLDSPHSFHRITGTKKALVIVKTTIKDLQGSKVIDTSKKEFSPGILES